MMKGFSILVLGLLINLSLLAQETWQTHFSYNKVTTVASIDNIHFGIGYSNLFSWDATSAKINTYTKLNGFREPLAKDLYVDGNRLFVVFENSSVEMFDPISQKQLNFSDVKRLLPHYDRTIYDLKALSNTVYLSTGQGIVVWDVSKNNIREIYQIRKDTMPSVVYSCLIEDDYIIASTHLGLFKCSRMLNGQNSGNWHKIIDKDGNSPIVRKLLNYNGRHYALRSAIQKPKPVGGVGFFACQFSGTTIEWNALEERSNFINAKIANGKLIYFTPSELFVTNWQGETKTFHTSTLNDAWVDHQESIYLAKGLNGWSKLPATGQEEPLPLPPGPLYNTPWRLLVHQNGIYMTPGGYGSDRLQRPGTVMYYKDHVWSSLTALDLYPDYKGVFNDVLQIIFDPQNDQKMYMTTWGEGLFITENNQLVHHYDHTNSEIESAVAGAINYNRVNGMAFDSQNNLWLLNSVAAVVNNIKVLHPNGDWTSIKIPHNAQDIFQDIVILKDESTKVSSCIAGGGIEGALVFLNDNHTIDDLSDDVIKRYNVFFDQHQSLMPIKLYNAIVEDNNGDLWVGTDNGVMIISDPQQFVTDQMNCFRPICNNSPLLEMESVSSIYVDTLNNKWIGTHNSGVYYINKEGTEILQHFHVDNSPLTTNVILSLALNLENNTLYIGSYEGLYAIDLDGPVGLEPDWELRGSARRDKIQIYPNPTSGELCIPIETEEPLLMNVYNQVGQKVLQIKTDNKRASIHSLADGIYLIEGVTSQYRFINRVILKR